MKKMTSVLFISIITLLMILSIIIPDKVISSNERRHFEVFPKFTFELLMNGKYLASIEPYLLDHMPFRDKFREIKVWIETVIFNKSDINKIYFTDDHLLKIEYPYNKDMGKKFLEYIDKIKDRYLENNDVYVGIIPDKNYFGSDQSLKMDYEELINDVKTGEYIYINLFDDLELNSYYKTDPHWKQEKLGFVVDHLSKVMDFKIAYSIDEMDKNKYDNFYGAYAGQSSINVKPERLTYLSHYIFDNAIVKNYEKETETEIYNKTLLLGIDSYDIFLAGASPLIEITNDEANSDKELIIFRDSFSSSLVPLLIGSYQKITLVDTRYVSYEQLENFIEFDNQDILFLYSTLVVNNSVMLR